MKLIDLSNHIMVVLCSSQGDRLGFSADYSSGSGTDGKKKRGRPFGSKKAVIADNVQVDAADGGMSMQAVAEPPCPNSKGKDVL